MMETLKNIFTEHKETLMWCVLFLWIILLAIGTLAEVYDFKSILNWPIWKIPGSG